MITLPIICHYLPFRKKTNVGTYDGFILIKIYSYTTTIYAVGTVYVNLTIYGHLMALILTLSFISTSIQFIRTQDIM